MFLGDAEVNEARNCFHYCRQALRRPGSCAGHHSYRHPLQCQGALATLSASHDQWSLCSPLYVMDSNYEFCCLVISVASGIFVYFQCYLSIYPLTPSSYVYISLKKKKQQKKPPNRPCIFSPTSWDKAIYSLLEFGQQTLVQFAMVRVWGVMLFKAGYYQDSSDW